MEQVPKEIREEFPAVLTKRSAMSRDMVADLNMMVDHAVGPGPVANIIRERHTRRYTEKMKSYYEAIVTRMKKDCKQPMPLRTDYSLISNRELLPDFSKFTDPQGYAGFTPSG
jgi:hypothetical protein